MPRHRHRQFRHDTKNRFEERRERVEGGEGGGDRKGGRQDYRLAPKESKLFEQYYKGQSIVPEDEFDGMIKKLQQPLPSTFRITGFTSHATEMLRIIKGDYLKDLVNIEIDNRVIQPTKCLSWYPGELAWQLDLERKLIRQNDSLKRLHKFLVQETESGNISRQEAVSMIPPLLLDIEPHHKVLDMCAAPGSKTAQLIEMLHGDESKGAPEGYVIANDSDNKRCYLMVHQIGRLGSPNYAVVNMDASNLPNLAHQTLAGKYEAVKFDRILCDVPCSGDGTLRKNVDAWHRWNPNVGHGLHNLQIRILRRGLSLLAEGGRLVYSTCSFNPVENEAVLVHVLRLMKGTVELVDVSERLPGLLREKGRDSWRVMTKSGEWFETFADVPETLHTQIAPSSFPPTTEEAQAFGLHKCLRILPHKQDSGAFFVAVLRRVTVATTSSNAANGSSDDVSTAINKDSAAEEKLSTEEVEQVAEASSRDVASLSQTGVAVKRRAEEDLENSRGGPFRKKPRHLGYKEDPFIFLKQEDKMWLPIQEFFGISPEFPFAQLMVRCETGKKRNVYFVSKAVKDLVQLNEGNFKFINLGVKILSRSSSKAVECEFRLVQDGLHILFPYITKRIVRFAEVQDVVTLLSSENPYVNRMSASTQNQMENMGQGGCVFIYEPEQRAEGPQCPLVLCGWKGKVSCRSFLPKNDRGHFLRLCGVELQEKDATTSEVAASNEELSAVGDDEEKEEEDNEPSDAEAKEESEGLMIEGPDDQEEEPNEKKPDQSDQSKEALNVIDGSDEKETDAKTVS